MLTFKANIDCNSKGFTLIEILVAMVVLAVGLLGMAAMTILVMKGSRGASDLTAATNICQLRMEELKDVDWNSLGNFPLTDMTNAALYGLANGDMIQETDLNSQARRCDQQNPDDCTSKTQGPYKFTRTYVICKGDDFTGSAGQATPPAYTAPGALPTPGQPPAAKDCSVDPTAGYAGQFNSNSTRVQWMACDGNDITSMPGGGVPGSNPEKKIKVLCTWRSRDGECHSVHIDTTVVKLGS
ncbi:MAG: prepilin-type N-terminal cleavage/methylation domain-containing protein [Pseudomonadota bacterium]